MSGEPGGTLRLQSPRHDGRRSDPPPAGDIHIVNGLKHRYPLPCPGVGQLVVVHKRPFVVTEIVPPTTGGSKPNHLLNHRPWKMTAWANAIRRYSSTRKKWL